MKVLYLKYLKIIINRKLNINENLNDMSNLIDNEKYEFNI